MDKNQLIDELKNTKNKIECLITILEKKDYSDYKWMTEHEANHFLGIYPSDLKAFQDGTNKLSEIRMDGQILYKRSEVESIIRANRLQLEEAYDNLIYSLDTQN